MQNSGKIIRLYEVSKDFICPSNMKNDNIAVKYTNLHFTRFAV